MINHTYYNIGYSKKQKKDQRFYLCVTKLIPSEP